MWKRRWENLYFIHQIFKIKQRNVKSTIYGKPCWKMKKKNWIFLFPLLVLLRDRCADIESVWIPEKQFSHPLVLVFSTPARNFLQTILLGPAASLFFVAFSTNNIWHKRPSGPASLCLHRVIFRFDVTDIKCMVIIVIVIRCHC